MNSSISRTGILLALFIFICQSSFSQTIEKRLKEDNSVSDYILSPELKTPSSINFKESANVASANAKSVIQRLFALEGSNELRSISITELKNNVKVEKFKQYFKGIRIEHSAYNVISKNGVILSISSESYPIEQGFSTTPQVQPIIARAKAMAFVNARKYVWDALEEDKRLYPGNVYMQQRLEALKREHTPRPELVIAKDLFGTKAARLAYKYDIYAVEPLSRHYIYVDAINGKILLSDAIIKHADEIKKDPRADSLKHVPNHVYYGLAPLNYFKYAPTRTTASVLASGITRYAGTRQFYTTRIDVLLSAQDPNNESAPLQYSGIDPRVPVSNQTVYILKDDTRGGGIETYDCNAVGGAPLSLPGIHEQALAFVDKNNIWLDEITPGTQEDHRRGTTANGSVGADEAANDDIAIDAHWGASMVYDYWKQVHNRLSYDNKNTSIRSYVHYGPAYDNAFWNGSVMTYGDGSGTGANGFKPLVSLDVCGHEIGHGVCTFTSDLVYQSESGAMNEGLSDIWAACVERFVEKNVDATLNFQEFQIGEQISADNVGLRRMDDPKVKTDPDTYGGRYWQNPNCTPTLANDQCGVHTNSGVLNKWFYLMVQGPQTTTGSPAVTDDGQADKPRTTPGGTDWVENTGNDYRASALPEFKALGFDTSEAITYLMELSLTPNATFAQARVASINAAKVLYGPCSQAEQSVTDAWFAVNVGAAWAVCTAPALSVNILRDSISEGSGDCGSFSEYTIGVSLIIAQGTATTVNFTTNSGTAEAHDYQLSATSVTFNAGETGNKTVILRIFNDDMVEGTETVDLNSSSAFMGFNTSKTITILDDDVLPKLGNTFTLLTENFDAVPHNTLPTDWARVDKTNPSGARWNVALNTGSSTGQRAYIYNPTPPVLTMNTATYDINVASQVILRTRLIDGRGLDSIKLRFLWTAGGETACSPACDYGDVVYSFDGVTFNRFDPDTSRTAGSASEPLFMSAGDSTYTQILPEILNNKQFYLGFQWTNDALATTNPYSISIDSIVVTGQGRKIETDSFSAVTTPVRFEPGNPVYFYSEDDKGLLSSIINASADLGCVKDTLIQTGNGTQPYPGGTRTKKVFEITPELNSTAAYTLTLYFTAAELAGFAPAPSQLKLLKSNAPTIDQANTSNSIIVTPVFIDSSAQGFYGYQYTFTGFSKFALVDANFPLPVNCLDFKASKSNNAVMLSWKVNAERNNSHFEIERSDDGITFRKIGQVAASGTANGQYSYNDATVIGLKNAYYRLKQVDITGEYKYLCTVLFVSLDGRNVFVIGNIYPNPGGSNSTVNITTSDKRKLKVEYVNMAGQTMNRHTEDVAAGTTQISLKVNALAAGSYMVRFKDEQDRIISTQQYIKQ